MKIVILTLGSAGDLHPFLAVARALHEHGADVLLATQAGHEAEVQAQGVPFAAIASASDEARTRAHPDLWHPVRGLGVLWRHLAVPSIGPTCALLRQHAQAGPLRVLASPLAIGARLAADRWPMRLTVAHLSPTSLRSCADPFFLGPLRLPAWWPQAWRPPLWRALDAWKLEPMARPALNAWRRAEGLPPIEGSVFGDWLHAGQAVCGLWDAAFAPPPPDAPAGFWLPGFVLYEPGTAESPEPAPPAVVLYPGSAPTPAAAAMAQAQIALARQGVSCRLLLPDDGPQIPLSAWLADAQVFVHHGGIGSIAQGLRAGVHQLMLPHAHDQPRNAWQLMQCLPQSADLCQPAQLVEHIHRHLDRPRPAPWSLKPSLPGAPNAAVRALVEHLTH